MGAPKEHTVGKKLFDSFFIMIVVSVVIGIIGFRGSAHIQRSTQVVVSVDLPAVEYLLETERDLQQLLVAERTLMMTEKGSDIYKELLLEYEENFQQAAEGWKSFKGLGRSDEMQTKIDEFDASWEKWKEASEKVITAIMSNTKNANVLLIAVSEAKVEFEKLTQYLNELTEIAKARAEKESASAKSTYKTSRNWIFIFTGGGLIIGIFLIILNRKGIVMPLKRAISGINDGADQVSSASGQLSEASQSLAAGASQQAASIEETSSALEEISSMIRQSSDNSKIAENLMKETKSVAELANDYMEQMSISMKEISAASEETSKIVKTIDEIAFQTNLLALNAAVEAARAGEAGAGFAVVADEVRSLAMRAAEAAKNTAEKIDATVRRVNSGAELSQTTQREFAKVTESSKKVAELIGEIAAASDEQAIGIGQIARSVDEMNGVTQQNAANAEESASSSEEMNAQARMMKGMVLDLKRMVGVRNGDGFHTARPAEEDAMEYHLAGEMVQQQQGDIVKKGEQLPQRNIIRAEEVIPLEEDDFADF